MKSTIRLSLPLVLLFFVLLNTACTSTTTQEVPLFPSTDEVFGGGTGKLVFNSNRVTSNYALYVFDLKTMTDTRISEGESSHVSGPFSPDGSKIVYTLFGDIGTDLYTMNADGSNVTQLTHDEAATNSFPAWSPGGTQIMFTAYKNENNDLFMMNADGSNVTQITNTAGDDWAAVWSPDGNTIVFLSDRDNAPGIYDLYLMNPDGTDVRRLTSDGTNHYSPVWSPDGTRIAYRGNVQEGPGDIFVMNADGTNLKNLTNHPGEDWSPAWSPDGTMIAFQSDRDGNWDIFVMTAEGTRLTNLTKTHTDDQMPFWQP